MHTTRAKEQGEDNHLHDEHRLAPKVIRQAAEADGSNQDPAQAGGRHQAILRGADLELACDKG